MKKRLRLVFSQPENIDTHSPPALRFAPLRGPLKVGAMVLWLEHPRYVAARDRLIEYLRSSKYRFRRLPPILFLCGGVGSPNRDTLSAYLRKRSHNIGIFYAERVWDQIASRTERSALEMESVLAQLADLVVVIAESPGTFAELGAFSLSSDLRKKVLPIIDDQYRNEKSFISTGPLRWIDRDSRFAPTIYVPLPRILEAVDQVEDRISRIPRPRTVRITDLAESPKHLVFFMCDLISAIHPVTEEMIEYYVRLIAPSILTNKIDVPTLVGLGVAMGLLRDHSVMTECGSRTFFSPAGPDALERPFHHRRLLDLESLRAAHVSVLLTLPQAREVLDELKKFA